VCATIMSPLRGLCCSIDIVAGIFLRYRKLTRMSPALIVCFIVRENNVTRRRLMWMSDCTFRILPSPQFPAEQRTSKTHRCNNTPTPKGCHYCRNTLPRRGDIILPIVQITVLSNSIEKIIPFDRSAYMGARVPE
jgi:hypothetical protein